MPRSQPANPNFEADVRGSFERQHMMRTLGASLTGVGPGEVEISLPYSADLTQQHGYLHAAAITAVADSACGYAAMTLLEPGGEVLSVEFKINLLAPAAGDSFRAVGRVIRAGRTITVCSAEVHARAAGVETIVAVMQATMFSWSGGADG
jgi:uncharacterized protein (TIGR00369 family)